MRCSNEYKALLIKINNQKANYAQKELFVSTDLEQKIQLYTEKRQKWTIRILVASVVMMILLGMIYNLLQIINQRWLIIVIISVMILVFCTFIGFELFYKFKIKKLNAQKIKEDEEKTNVRQRVVSLNDQISTLVVSIIVLNEHFYELSSIENEEERIKKWQKYVLEIVEAINSKYFYHPTYTEYQEYYKNYEYFMKEKESFE